MTSSHPTSDPHHTPPPVLFFDHVISPSNPYSLAVFSHWFPSPFTSPAHRGLTFRTAEHWMMFHKARLFDPSLCQPILDAPTPARAKELGRQVRGFDRAKWNAVADEIVEEGNYLKFAQDKERRDALVRTKGRRLVECNPDDRIWGIGWSVDEAMSHTDDWGANRMGDALARVRYRIIKESEAK